MSPRSSKMARESRGENIPENIPTVHVTDKPGVSREPQARNSARRRPPGRYARPHWGGRSPDLPAPVARPGGSCRRAARMSAPMGLDADAIAVPRRLARRLGCRWRSHGDTASDRLSPNEWPSLSYMSPIQATGQQTASIAPTRHIRQWSSVVPRTLRRPRVRWPAVAPRLRPS